LILPRALRRKKDQGALERLVPRGPAHAIEAICHYLREEVARPALGAHTDRFIKYIWSVFFFVLTLNLLGILPIAPVTSLFHLEVGGVDLHIGGTATANIWVTATLATLTVLMMVVNGLRIGKVDFLKHLVPGPLLLKPLMLVIEVIGIGAKGFALAIRLFANMVAGHTLMAVLLGFILSAFSVGIGLGFGVAIPVVLGSVAISMLEIFVAFLQAFIFAFLTALFLGQSVNVHHDDHHGEAHA
ncbi:MAG: F0F1 ATP synthase subunit A, partial [Acidobacteriota bacterium]|nr:F0F1 ATP synthase subunit A [Acidobacteriota bacterium]